MIEVLPNSPEAPHLRSSIPHPKTNWLQRTSGCIPTNDPMVEVYMDVIFETRLAFPRFWAKKTRH